jgi:hypothetical protein
MDPNRKNPEPTGDDEPVAEETYTTFSREDADFPDLDPLIEAYTDEENETTPGKK